MNKKFWIFCLLFVSIIIFSFGQINKRQPEKQPPYASSKTLQEAILFGEGIITTNDDEFGGTFSPDGKICFFSKSVLRFYLDVICFSEYKNGRWNTPKVAPFSGTYRDFDPVMSPDGQTMLFTSNRPINGELKSDYDIWMVKRKGNQWSEPIHLDSTVNSSASEHFASMAANGNIYFSSERPGAMGGAGDADIYCSKLVNGKYMPAEHLEAASSTSYELDCTIAPDESFLLTGSYGRQDGLGNYDIFISVKVGNKWEASKNIGPKVNSKNRDYSPRISPDGKYLFLPVKKIFLLRHGRG